MNSMTMSVNISEKKNRKKVKNFFLFFYFIVLLNRKSVDFIYKIGYDEMKSVLKLISGLVELNARKIWKEDKLQSSQLGEDIWRSNKKLVQKIL